MAQDFESPLGPPSLERNKLLSECLAGFARQYENFAAICQPDIRDMIQHKAHGLAKAAEAFEYAEVPIESGKHAAKTLPGIGKVTGETVQEMLVRGGSTTKFRKEYMPEWLVKRTEAAAKEAKAAKAAAKRAEKAAAGGSGAAKKRGSNTRAKAADSEEEEGSDDSDVIAVDDEDGGRYGAGVGSKRAASSRAKRPAAKRARRSDDDEEDEDSNEDDDEDDEEEDDEEAEYKPRKSRSRGGAGASSAAAAAGGKKPATAAAKGRGKAAPVAAAVATGSTESTAIDVVGSSDEEKEEGGSSARAAGTAGKAGKAKAAAAPRKRAAAASKSAAASGSDEDDEEGAKAAKPAPRKRAPAKPKAAKAEKPFKVPKSAKGPEWMAKIWDHATPEERAAASLERNARVASLIQALAKATQTAAAGLPREQATSAWYKITAFEKAAKTIADCTSPLLSGEHARCLPGVGEGVAAIVQQIIETGKLEGVEEEAPGQTGVAALVRVPGISQTLAGRLVRDEKINTPADLQAAVRNGATFDLPPDALVAARFAAELLLPLPRTEAADLLGRVLAAAAAAGSAGSAAAAAADGGITVVAGGGYIRGESPLQALDLLVTAPAFTVPHPETFGMPGHPAAQAAPAVGGAGGSSSGASAEEAAAMGAQLLAQLVAALQAAGVVVEAVPQTHALAADLIVRLPEAGAAGGAGAGGGGGRVAAGSAAAASALPPAEEANPFADFELPPAEDGGDDDGGYGGSAASASAAKGAATGAAGGSGAGSLLSHEEMRLMRAGAAAARSASSTGGDSGRAATGTGGPSEQASADASADDEAREAAGLQPGQHAARFMRLLAVPYNCLGPAFLRSSSSEAFWASLQAHAIRRGLRLSEFALQPFVAHAIEEAAAAPSRGTKGMAFAGSKKKKAAAAAAGSAGAGPAADVKPSAAELATAEASGDVKPTAAELAATEAGAPHAPAAAAAASTFREYGPALVLEGGDEAVFAALQLDYVPPEQRALPLGGAEAAAGADAPSSSSSAALASAEAL